MSRISLIQRRMPIVDQPRGKRHNGSGETSGESLFSRLCLIPSGRLRVPSLETPPAEGSTHKVVFGDRMLYPRIERRVCGLRPLAWMCCDARWLEGARPDTSWCGALCEDLYVTIRKPGGASLVRRRTPSRVAHIRRLRNKSKEVDAPVLKRWHLVEKLLLTLPSVTAVAALYFTAGALDATRDQIIVSEQGQITERFGKALEQLGSDVIITRLGGIYALERLAIDSPRDHLTIVDVLSSYVRERAPIGDSCGKSSRPPTDIQAAVTVLARRIVDPTVAQQPIDLRAACLANVDFSGGWTFGDVRVPGRSIDPSMENRDRDRDGVFETQVFGDFRNANLADSDLTNAVLHNAMLEGVNLTQAKLTRGTYSRRTFNDRIVVGRAGVYLNDALVGAQEVFK